MQSAMQAGSMQQAQARHAHACGTCIARTASASASGSASAAAAVAVCEVTTSDGAQVTGATEEFHALNASRRAARCRVAGHGAKGLSVAHQIAVTHRSFCPHPAVLDAMADIGAAGVPVARQCGATHPGEQCREAEREASHGDLETFCGAQMSSRGAAECLRPVS